MYVYKRQKLIMRDINYGGNQILTWAQPAKIYWKQSQDYWSS